MVVPFERLSWVCSESLTIHNFTDLVKNWHFWELMVTHLSRWKSGCRCWLVSCVLPWTSTSSIRHITSGSLARISLHCKECHRTGPLGWTTGLTFNLHVTAILMPTLYHDTIKVSLMLLPTLQQWFWTRLPLRDETSLVLKSCWLHALCPKP